MISLIEYKMTENLIKIGYEYFRLLQFYFSPISALKSIHIQLNNFCNLRCKWCSFVNPKKKQIMSNELLINLFDEIMEDDRFRIKEINLWNAGEPLLHPNFIDIMEIISSYKQKYGNFPRIKILTNTMVLNEKLSKKIIKIGAIDYIGFSIDGGSKEEHEKIRVGGNFNIAKKNIQKFLRLNKGKIETMINCVIPLNKPLNTEWMSEDFRNLLNSVDFFKLNYPDNNGGVIFIKYPSNFKFNKTNKRVCLAMLQGLVVLQNGDVLFCCNDFNGDYFLGNLYQKSLFEICNSKKRKDLVKTFLKGERNQIPLCKICNRFEIPYKIYKNDKKT